MWIADVLMRELGGGERAQGSQGEQQCEWDALRRRSRQVRSSTNARMTPSAKQCACLTAESTDRIVVWALARRCPQCGAARRLRQAGVPVRPCRCSIFPLPSAASLAHTAPDAAQSNLRRHFVGLLYFPAKSAAARCSLLRRRILLKTKAAKTRACGPRTPPEQANHQHTPRR